MASTSARRTTSPLASLLAGLALLGTGPVAGAAEPAACFSGDPAQWPRPSKPYFMLVVDSSGSMIQSVGTPPSCAGYPDTRMGHAKCAVKNTLLGFGGQVNFGLAQFAATMTGCGASCYGNTANSPNPACVLSCYTAEINTTGLCGTCGPMDSPASPATRRGGRVLVPLQQDNRWTTPPTPSNLSQILSYVDNNCTNSLEITNPPTDGPQYGKTPLNGVLRDMKRYLESGWTNPDSSAESYPTPLSSLDLPCRSVNVILLTDGDETCDTQADAVSAATALFSTGVTVGGNTFKAKVHVINFAGGSMANANAIASAGGTGSAYYATNELQLAQALSSIVAGATPNETCDNADNNCNGCTDEGFAHYCHTGQTCCNWATTAQRTTCMTNYFASITGANPQGDRTKLPCTSESDAQSPARWLCHNPGDVCDGADNNCNADVDEGALKCGSPRHCPTAETCDGIDNDCDGVVDGAGVCPSCIPSAEVCDGCDNDCDSMADEGLTATSPCGFTGPGEPSYCAGVVTCKAPMSVPIGTCGANGGFTTCTFPPPGPQAETCDGLDGDCNGLVDDGISSASCSPSYAPAGLVYRDAAHPNSACVLGQTQCTNGMTSCVGWVGPSAEICDGIDNNCDGTVDNNTAGTGVPCGLNTPPCSPGTTACVNGALTCVGGTRPRPESCNGQDDDCNGQIDDGALADSPPAGQNGCWALPGSCCQFPAADPHLTWCPPPGAGCHDIGTLSGPCGRGTLVCSAGAWHCTGARAPSSELCDGLDNDCNGQTDDGTLPDVGTACGIEKGECHITTVACVAGSLTCPGGDPTAERCDGKDNDCDGQTDEDIAGTGSCAASYDAAQYPGPRTAGFCRGGNLSCDGSGNVRCLGAVGPAPETCDGIDNDCDGTTDEAGTAPDGIDGTADPADGAGTIGSACPASGPGCQGGTWKCAAGAFACAGSEQPRPETCDGIDNDCDGKTDEAAVSAASLCGNGGACVKSAIGSGAACATTCAETGAPCPTGQVCGTAIESGSGATLDRFCVPCPAGGCRTLDAGSDAGGADGAGAAEDGAGGISGSDGAPDAVHHDTSSGCGCGIGTAGGTAAPLILLIAAVMLRPRRRSRGASAALACGIAVLVLAGSGCEDHSTTRCTGAACDSSMPDLPGSGDAGSDAIGSDRTPVFDAASPQTCGTADNDCFDLPGTNWDPATVTCAAGKCAGSCAGAYQDRDGDGRCETFCVSAAANDLTCDGIDDNCNGKTDEGIDLCTAVSNCGACGRSCSRPHAATACQHTGAEACTAANTECVVTLCDCDGPTDCWWDLDGQPGNGCEHACYPSDGGAGKGVEVCGDAIDNDCDGKTDEEDDLSGDPGVGVACHGGTKGECATLAHVGQTVCVAHKVVCQGATLLVPGQLPETCNGKDDDCDGTTDNAPSGVGTTCGQSAISPCQKGVSRCVNGALVCVGAVEPKDEACDGIDNDCDGTIDNNLTGIVGQPCNVPLPPPSGATSACKAGTTLCTGGVLGCIGSAGPSSSSDTCGVDANCDGALTNQPDVNTDVHNCGACGNDCLAGAVHASWSCAVKQCVFQACQPGYHDLDGDHKCEYACTFVSSQELCNGVDENCNGQIDEAAITPSPAQVCGVSPSATAPECQVRSAGTPNGVALTCTGGAWKCTFAAGVCSPTCAGATEVCDTLDNNCNGLVNENVPNWGQPCASDDGKPTPGDGVCRTTGTYVCSSATTVACSAVKDLTKAGPELCDGFDNDCDGIVDEPFSNKGTNTTYFVKPAVTKIGASLWMFSYEASRPSATAIVPGSGNGYQCATCTDVPNAPSGATIDKTPACSVQGRTPWFNVTPAEAEQTCQAMGGALCTSAQWQTACRTGTSTSCTWGYAAAGAACTSTYTGAKFCNLGPSYDFAPLTVGDQDGLLPTGSPLLQNCWADWTSLLGNGTTSGKLFDITGNLREITRTAANSYPLMGGSFQTADPNGATCSFTFYNVDQTFKLYDTGFRCCFTSDPTL